MLVGAQVDILRILRLAIAKLRFQSLAANLKVDWPILRFTRTSQPILRLTAKLTIQSWAYANIKISKISNWAPTLAPIFWLH